MDIGPICGDNISFLAQRVKRLFVCDMFLRLDRLRRRGLPPSRAWRHLDYQPKSFDGILLWELADRLGDDEADRLVELCYTILRPGGMVVLFTLGEQSDLSKVNSFVIKDNFKLYLRPQPHLALPLRGRENRDVLALWASFTPIKSFVYRNGLKEFLFQHD